MKVCIIQPKYSFNISEGKECFNKILELLDLCDNSIDVIVLPEYSDIPYDEKDAKRFIDVSKSNGSVLVDKVKQTARRCNSIVFFNAFDFTKTGMRNTTFVVDRQGEIIGKYYKTHPAPSEVKSVEMGGHGLDVGYSYNYDKPTTIEIEGVKFGFLTCYDFYFYEYYSRLARENIDVIIGCSLQRTDKHSVLETFGKFLSYNTNSYLIRSSVSLGDNSETCGTSMVVAPTGDVLLNMENRVGLGIIDIDVTKKYYKPAGYLGEQQAHYKYVEEGRRPWLYRPAGSFVVNNDSQMPYPRICAHRGFNTIAPENSMPAFGAAIGLGADEIEFDIWATRDGELVSIHDPTLERVSNGIGNVWDYTYDELSKLDFGYKCKDEYKGLKIVKFEDILKKFACLTIMNIHVKIWDNEFDNKYYEKIGELIYQYDCQNYVYVMTTSNKCLQEFHQLYPGIHRCKGYLNDNYVDDAIMLKVEKVQLFKPYFNEEMIKKAHKNGIICNVFFSDDQEETIKFLSMGIDCILTNNYLQTRIALEKLINKE